MASSGYNFVLLQVFMMMMMIAAFVVHKSAAQNNTCGLGGSDCETDGQCCSRRCVRLSEGRPASGRRGARPPNVKCACTRAGSGTPCSSDKECCSGNRCSSSGCVACGLLRSTCNNDSDCCSPGSFCSNNKCTFCRLPNAFCTRDSNCCPGSHCSDSRCSLCRLLNASCTKDSDCCSLTGCSMVNGTNGGTCKLVKLNIPKIQIPILGDLI